MPDPNRRPESEEPEGWDDPVFGADSDAFDDDEPHFDEAHFDEPHFDEPVFGEAAYEDEPSFPAAASGPVSGYDEEDEEDLDYIPDPRVAESLSVGASAGGSNMPSRQSRRGCRTRRSQRRRVGLWQRAQAGSYWPVLADGRGRTDHHSCLHHALLAARQR
ncbi:MAG: hypothetical protein R2873_13090 [Caldilineaceae bacterium]